MRKGKKRKYAKKLRAGKIFDAVANARVKYRENGEPVAARRLEISAKRKIAAALQGDVEAAEDLMRTYEHARKHGDFEVKVNYL